MIAKISTTPCPQGEIELFGLENGSGAGVVLSNLGAGILSVKVPDRNGTLDDVALGYADPKSYFGDGACMGKVPGRYANRIAGGRFVLDGREYRLPVNNGPNHLHGGPDGFADRLWKASIEADSVVFALHSAAGDAGYPAAVDVRATYSWDDRCRLTLDLTAESDGATIINLTNHAYWNLAGENSGSVLGQELRIAASRWLPTDRTLIPTGEYAPVTGTPMDFRTAKPLGRDIGAAFDALTFGKGYDNCWIVDDSADGSLREAAELYDPVSGRCLNVFSDQVGVQIYTGNWLAGNPVSKSGRGYSDYDGVAIECQNFPDAPNHPSFPSAILRRGETFRRRIVFAFSVR